MYHFKLYEFTEDSHDYECEIKQKTIEGYNYENCECEQECLIRSIFQIYNNDLLVFESNLFEYINVEDLITNIQNNKDYIFNTKTINYLDKTYNTILKYTNADNSIEIYNESYKNAPIIKTYIKLDEDSKKNLLDTLTKFNNNPFPL